MASPRAGAAVAAEEARAAKAPAAKGRAAGRPAMAQGEEPPAMPAAEDEAVTERSVNISETFIRRPIATSLVMAAIALFGVVAYRSLPISDLPAVDYPTVNVSASLPGGDPVIMAA